jgi:5,6,7,8-tetrahydromethanopterin hydro-lyase
MTDSLDGRFGEFWSGEVPNGSHINVVLARRGSPTAAAAAAALAGPRPGIVPFLACLSPGLVVRPFTVVVNKSPIPDEPGPRLGPITWGAAQLGIAQGVLDAVAEGLIPAAEVPDVVVLVALWVDPAAHDETAVKRANREAMRGAIADALRPPTADEIIALAERREEAANIYYTGE